MSYSIELRGDWRKLRHKFDRFSKIGEYMAEEAMEKLAEKVREELHNVVNNPANFAPNTPSTSARKGFNNPMFESGGMMHPNSMVAYPSWEGDRYKYQITGNESMATRRTNITYGDVININEKGGGSVPGRHALEITYHRKRKEIEAMAIKELQSFMRG